MADLSADQGSPSGDSASDRLRGMVRQRLDQAGILASLKAQLRANVFHALSETGQVPEVDRQQLSATLATANGRAALGLLADCLRLCKLNYTAETLAAEMACDLNTLPSREQLQNILTLSSDNDQPLVVSAVSRLRERSLEASISHISAPASAAASHITPQLLREARRSFQKFDQAGSGMLRRHELRDSLQELFPGVPSSKLEIYIAEEAATHSRDYSISVDFDEYLSLFIRLSQDHQPASRTPTGGGSSSRSGNPVSVTIGRGQQPPTLQGAAAAEASPAARGGENLGSAAPPADAAGAHSKSLLGDLPPVAPRSTLSSLGPTTSTQDVPPSANLLSGVDTRRSSATGPRVSGSTFLTQSPQSNASPHEREMSSSRRSSSLSPAKNSPGLTPEDSQRLQDVDRRLSEIRAQRAQYAAELNKSPNKTPTGLSPADPFPKSQRFSTDYGDDFEEPGSANTLTGADEVMEEEVPSAIGSDRSAGSFDRQFAARPYGGNDGRYNDDDNLSAITSDFSLEGDDTRRSGMDYREEIE